MRELKILSLIFFFFALFSCHYLEGITNVDYFVSSQKIKTSFSNINDIYIRFYITNNKIYIFMISHDNALMKKIDLFENYKDKLHHITQEDCKKIQKALEKGISLLHRNTEKKIFLIISVSEYNEALFFSKLINSISRDKKIFSSYLLTVEPYLIADENRSFYTNKVFKISLSKLLSLQETPTLIENLLRGNSNIALISIEKSVKDDSIIWINDELTKRGISSIIYTHKKIADDIYNFIKVGLKTNPLYKLLYLWKKEHPKPEVILYGNLGFSPEQKKNIIEKKRKYYKLLANEYEEAGDIKNAIKFYELSLSKVIRIEDYTFLEHIVKLYYKIGNLDKAIKISKILLEKALVQKNQKRIIKSYKRLIFYFNSIYRYSEALSYEKKIIEYLLRKNKRDRELYFAKVSLSILYSKLKNTDKAIEILSNVLNNTKMFIVKAKAYAVLGNIYFNNLENYREALIAYRKAEELYKNLGKKIEVYEIKKALGLVYIRLGIFTTALLMFRDIHKYSIKEKKKSLEIDALIRLGQIYREIGFFDKALTNAKSAVSMAKKISDNKREGIALSLLGLIYLSLGNFEQALENEDKALNLFYGKIIDRAIVYNNIGLIYREKREYSRALKYFKQALEINKNVGSISTESYILKNLGITYFYNSDTNTALKYLLKSLDISEKLGERSNTVKILNNIGLIYEDLEKFDKARLNYQKATLLSRTMSLRDSMWFGYFRLGMISLKEGNDIEALDLMNRAVNIVEGIRINARIKHELNDFFFNKQELYNKLISLYVKLKRPIDALWISERARARTLFDDIIGKSIYFGKNSSNQDAKLFYPLSIINNLPIDTVIVQYHIDRDKLYIWVLKQGWYKLYSMKIRGLEEYIAILQKNVRKGHITDTILSKLYDILIRKVRDQLTASHLVIIPHSILHYIPFSALYDGKNYLVDSLAISYANSLSLYKLLRDKQNRSNGMILALASYKSLKPIDNSKGQQNIKAELPFAYKEVKNVKNWYPYRTKLLIGPMATETAIKKNAYNYQILHIASHGYFNSRMPLYSYLLLEADEENDGKLMTIEIFDMKIKANIVILSACESGLGKIFSGDEITGLSNAFFTAGAKSVISALWRVDDVSTAIIIKRVYRNMDTMDISQALRKAQLIVKKNFSNPIFWAGLTLNGSWY